MPGAIPTGLFRGWQDAKLPEEIARIPVDPVVDALTVLELRDRAAVGDRMQVRRRDTHEVTAMRARGDPARDDEIAIGQLLLDLETKVGKGGDVDTHELGQALRAVDGRWQSIALGDELLTDNFRQTVGIVGSPGLDVFA